MRSADIKVGEEYAYFPHRYSTARRVKVLETKVPERQGWGYKAHTVKSGVRVEQLDGGLVGNQSVVSSRQIERPWAEQARMNQAAKEAAEARADHARKQAASRANLAKRLDDHLAAHGVEARTQTVYGRWSEAALKEVGFEVGDGPVPNFTSRVTDLHGLMRTGNVDLRDVEVLLADVEARA